MYNNEIRGLVYLAVNFIMKYLSITKAYILWVLVGLTATLIAAYTGEYWALMSQAVQSTGELVDGLSHDEMVVSFIVISSVVWLFGVLLGAFLVWMTNKQKQWARYLLILFCVYQIGWQIYGAVTMQRDYALSIGADDWLFGVASILIITYVAIASYFKPSAINES